MKGALATAVVKGNDDAKDLVSACLEAYGLTPLVEVFFNRRLGSEMTQRISRGDKQQFRDCRLYKFFKKSIFTATNNLILCNDDNF